MLPLGALVAETSDAPVAPASTTAPAGSRLLAIDLLRGAAVLWVVFAHMPITWADLGAHPSAAITMPAHVRIALEYGRIGVHLFLIISGFCIHLQWARTADVTQGLDFGAFWKKRLRRLYPPYFVALVLTLVVAFVLNAVVRDRTSSVGAMFGYAETWQLAFDLGLLLVLAQNLTIASHRVGNGPFWSLALEEQLYMLYFALLSVRRRFGWAAVFVMTGSVSLVWRAAWWRASASLPEAWLGIGPSRWFEWALGAYAVEAYRGHVPLPAFMRRFSTFVLLFALALWATPAQGTWHVPAFMVVVRDPLWGMAFFVLVNALCRVDFSLENARTRWAVRLAGLGTVSYSVYLVHNPLVVVATRIAVASGVDSLPLLVVMRFVVALLGGVVFYRLVETRFLRRR